jgi:hypothetical protein
MAAISGLLYRDIISTSTASLGCSRSQDSQQLRRLKSARYAGNYLHQKDRPERHPFGTNRL